jgi:hypothetical protein
MASFGQALRRRVAVGTPRSFEPLTLHPLIAVSPSSPRLILFDEALARGLVEVTEVSSSGTVPNLKIANRADLPVCVLEGQELQGGKQNRVVNVTLLVAARSEMEVPVSCVERGRWAYRSERFSSGSYSSVSLRSVLRASVGRAVASGQGYRSDQGAIWEEVDSTLDRTGQLSATSSLADGYAAALPDVEPLIEAFPVEEGQVGILVSARGRPIALELFPDPRSYARVRRKVLGAYAFAVLYDPPRAARIADVAGFLGALDGIEPRRSPSVGLGTDLRADTAELSVTALELDGEYVHASALVS